MDFLLFIIIIIIYSLEFSHQRKLMLFHWRLSDSKSPQVSRSLLSILAVFKNAVVWMVSTRSPTSKSSRPFNNPLVTVFLFESFSHQLTLMVFHWSFSDSNSPQVSRIFLSILVLCEMQSVSSKIWTRIAVSISCYDNHYTTGTYRVL